MAAFQLVLLFQFYHLSLLGQLTEFCGEPGIGKTQVGIQLAINAHIPEAYGGANGTSIYIDTEGSFMTERVVEMAIVLSEHISKLAAYREASEPGQVYPRSYFIHAAYI